MNKIPYEKRLETYTNVMIAYGEHHQITKCLEEMGECIQAICKVMNGEDDFAHLAEEIADVTITMEQMRMIFGINDKVCEFMDAKVLRLDAQLHREAFLRDKAGR